MRSLFERHRFLASFVLLNTVMGVSVGLGKVTAPLYALHLGADEALLGLVAGAQSAGILLISLPMGFLVERFGPARMFRIGSLWAGLIYACVPAVAAPLFLLVCTFAISFFMPFRFVPMNTLFLEQLATLGEEKAGWARGSHMLGTALIGPALAATCIAAIGYSATYWLIAALFLVSIFMSGTVLGRVHQAAVPPRALSWPEIRRQLALVARDPELRSACTVDFCAQGITMFYNFFIVVIAIDEFGLGVEQASGLVGAHGLAYVLALLTLGAFANRTGSLQSYLVSVSILSVALLLLGTARAPDVLWPGGLLLGVGLGLLQIVNLMRFARLGASIGRGKIAGLNALVGPAGGLFGSVGGGLLGQRLGLQNVFLVFVPLLALLFWQLRARYAAAAAPA